MVVEIRSRVRFGVPGLSDICGVMAPDGRALFIETKAPNGTQRPDQVAFQQTVERQGGVYRLVRPGDPIDLI